MIKLIGTTHIMPKEEIYKLLSDNKPEIIAVEFCEIRYNLMVRPLLYNYLNKTKSRTRKYTIWF